MTNNSQSQQNTSPDGQALTQEQLRDVYMAGTSDGVVQLADQTVTIPNTGYEKDEKEQD